MKKRVREESAAAKEEEEDGGAPEKANQFGQWLLENIYKYADVRDSERLANVTKMYKVTRKRFDDLLAYVRADGEMANDIDVCFGCGRTDVTEVRSDCTECEYGLVSCSVCVPDLCASGKHELCFVCARLNIECDGRDHYWCTKPDAMGSDDD
jgi:hypothetical protein